MALTQRTAEAAAPGRADAAHHRGAAPGRANAAHHRGAAPGGADAVRNPLLSDMAAAGSCFGVWNILGFDSLEVSRVMGWVMGAHMWALTH